MKLKELLTEDVLKVVSEDSINAIEEALKKKVELSVETALSHQDEEYAEKLEKLLEAIDKDCTLKLKRVVEAIDKNNTKKLKTVVRKYEKLVTEDAKTFKVQVVNSVSKFIDAYIDKAIPSETLTEAVKNKTALNVLGNLRNVLAVDSTLMNESVKAGLQDGKRQIDELRKQVNLLKKQNQTLAEKAERTEAALLIEQKTAGMTASRKKHLMKTLSDKSVDFIKENFEYTKDLIIRSEKERAEQLKQEAFKKRTIKSDVVNEKVEEQDETGKNTNPYLAELQKFK